MEKKFNEWNTLKIQLESRESKYLFKESEIWWCSIGINIQSESCGEGENFRRPVLILKKLSSKTFIGIPISRQLKYGTWFTEITIHNEKRCVLLYQARMLSASRLERRWGVLDNSEFSKVQKNLKLLLEI